MSRYEWEEGTITLPSSEFSRVRQAVADAVRQDRERAYELAQEFWRGLNAKEKRDPEAYRKAYDWFCHVQTMKMQGLRRGHEVHRFPESFAEAVEPVVGAVPKRVKKTDLPLPTNRDTTFDADDAVIVFDRESNTVHWLVDANNHAVDAARSSRFGEAFFNSLNKVRWTRNTGGVFAGNDEYNEDNSNVGGGGNYCTQGFGPVGADQAPYHTAPFVMANGKRYSQDDGSFDQLSASMRAAERRASGAQGRRRNGQFDHKAWTESDVHLY